MASENITKILDEIKALSVVELFDLEKAIEEEFGVTAAAMVASAPAAGGAAAAEEKTEFTVMLKSFGDAKMGVIKAVKDVMGLGLKDAKELVEKAPVALKENVSKEEADDLMKKLADCGAELELK
ncbi:MAG: 50S ribosomal protein L7/L12 [Saccharofermentans sp.]|nr:50S ribosomal protein L7/L12 [Saccharofermentans sp.]